MKRLPYWLLSALFFIAAIAQANSPANSNSPVSLKAFELGSFGQIVTDKSQQDHLVILWSFDCPPCITELEKVSQLHQQFPDYQLTLINTDGFEEQDRVNKLIQQFNLAGLDNWAFSQVDEQQLRYDIDPRWYGDLPRSYFFPVQGKIQRLTGALSSDELLVLFQPN